MGTKKSVTALDAQSDSLFGDNSTKAIEEDHFRDHHGDVHASFVHRDSSKYLRIAGDATGSANAITVSIDYPAALTEDIPIQFKASNTNTGAVTFQVNSLTAKNIYDHTGAQVTTAGAITSGERYEVVYDTDAGGASVAGYVLTKTGATTGASAQFDSYTDQAGSGPAEFPEGALVSDDGADDGSSYPSFQLKNENASSSWTVGGILGAYDFYGADPSGGGAGVRAAIRATVETTGGGRYALRFYTDNNAGLTETMFLDETGILHVEKVQNLAGDGPVELPLGAYSSNGSTASLSTSSSEQILTLNAGEIGILTVTTSSGNPSWRWYGFIHGNHTAGVTITSLGSANITVTNSGYNVSVQNDGSAAVLKWSYIRTQG